MGLVWRRVDSEDMQTQLKANLQAWDTALSGWSIQITAASESLGTTIQGNAANAIRSLFENRILPIVESGRSASAWTKYHLDAYATAEKQLIQDNDVLDEEVLQAAIDAANAEIRELQRNEAETRAALRVLGIVGIGIEIWLQNYHYGDKTAELREKIQTAQRELDNLRYFSAAMASVFAEEQALANTLSSAIESIKRGSLTADGQYQPSDEEYWLQTINEYVSFHPSTPAPQAIADTMKAELIRWGAIPPKPDDWPPSEDYPGHWYDDWLLNAATNGVSVDEILRIALNGGITPESFLILDKLEKWPDSDHKFFFYLPDGLTKDEITQAVIMTYVFNARTDYAIADDSDTTTRNNYAETPYSLEEFQRIKDRQKANGWSYTWVEGTDAVVATPNGMLMGVDNDWPEIWASLNGGTTYGDLFLLNITPENPKATLQDLVSKGKLGSLDLDRLLHHEEQHTEQWAKYGFVGFGASYIDDGVATGGNGYHNTWEQMAGSDDGGYHA